MKKLKINVVAGIINIVGTFLYFFSLFMIGNFTGAIGASDDTELLLNMFLLFAIVAIVINFISFFQSKNVKIRLFGPIFGLIGHAIYLVCGTYLAWVSMVLSLVAAIFILKDNNYSILDTIKHEEKDGD